MAFRKNKEAKCFVLHDKDSLKVSRKKVFEMQDLNFKNTLILNF